MHRILRTEFMLQNEANGTNPHLTTFGTFTSLAAGLEKTMCFREVVSPAGGIEFREMRKRPVPEGLSAFGGIDYSDGKHCGDRHKLLYFSLFISAFNTP